MSAFVGATETDAGAAPVAGPPASADAPAVPGTGDASADPNIIAVVGATTVSVEDLLIFSRKKPFTQQRLGLESGRADVLRELIENRLINMAAWERAGLDPDAAESELAKAVTKFEAAEFAPDAISAADVEAYYQEHRQSLGIPASVRIRDIVVPVSAGADLATKSDAQAQAESLLAQAKSGTPFEKLAAEHADTAALRKVAGDRGYVALSRYPYLQEATDDMQVGDFSDVIELPTGYQVFQLLGRRQGVPVSLDEAEVEIRRRLEAQSVERKRRQFFESYGNKLGVRVTVPELASAWQAPTSSQTGQ
jgi:parvulin-like peptidyl-prolyl isomerase